MSAPRHARPLRPRALDRSLTLVAVCIASLIGIQLALVLPGSGALWPAHVLLMVVVAVFAAAGLVAWHRRPGNRMGMLITVGGLAAYAASLGNTTVPALQAAGAITTTLVLAVVIHLLLAFPSGRVHGAAAIATVVAAYVVALVLQIPLYLFAGTLTALPARPGLVAAAALVQHAAGAAVMVATAAILTSRLVAADAAHRRVLAPLFAYGIVAVLAVPLRVPVLERALGLTGLQAAIVQFVLVIGIPIAFSIAVLRGGFAPTGELEELAAWLGQSGGSRTALAVALRRVLGDPSAQVLFWMPEPGCWVDADGLDSSWPVQAPRAATEVTLAGRRVGAIVYDSTLLADPAPVERAAQVVALAVERDRLLAALLAQHAQLVSSRARIVSAADRERRRVARDLHDGMQVRLVLLALDAQRIAAASDLADASAQAVALRVRIDAAAAELRRFVHEVMPSGLIERGLESATEDLVDRMPLPTTLHVDLPPRRLPEGVESTAYFVIAESLANALKHARAARLSVRVACSDGVLTVDVHDDGVGGVAGHADGGLRGLADRVDALGGALRVDSEPDFGTHVRAELPCAS